MEQESRLIHGKIQLHKVSTGEPGLPMHLSSARNTQLLMHKVPANDSEYASGIASIDGARICMRTRERKLAAETTVSNRSLSEQKTANSYSQTYF